MKLKISNVFNALKAFTPSKIIRPPASLAQIMLFAKKALRLFQIKAIGGKT
jgi:hypothetical protein